ncbi:MAG: triose-phosphate isomerase [Gammaproteobacteria bacterium]|nr:triose-phosphate isomerase [Gammaproteobacteria bacterium]
MMPKRKMLIAANWKMNGSQNLTKTLLEGLAVATQGSENEIAVFPPYPYLALTQDILRATPIRFGAQDLSAHDEGAYTGEVSASMLTDMGCYYVLIGHSERRAYHQESNELLLQKYQRASQQGLNPILCLGETQSERNANLTFQVINSQLLPFLTQDYLANMTIAYEPVWAIGTGKTATPDEAQVVHAFIREKIAEKDSSLANKIRILYGGSVKPNNARELFSLPDVDGGLIGGASLKKEEFIQLCRTTKI